ncbi:uncharacterized protein LOC121647552 [Melanotaenia boesemani]|uniref:uncharacterized protein LOC121647552 n=1 Tax=Melanotaenia boesemani TaxID=1250792 RepID=UPI001C045DF2|nr:uncharacterized protein LOC121647552 [Melanotaenia boesemani]
MNIIRKCYGELFGQHGLALFDQPPVSETSETDRQALQRCHQASITAHRGVGKVKVRGKGACRIPGGVMKVVAATCSEQYSGGTVLFEPLDSGLPAGLLAVPALVPVVRGTTYIPIMNVGSSDVLLYPRAVVGSLEEVQVVSLPAGITEVLPQVATVASQLVSPSVQEQIAAMELYHLPAEVQDKVRALLGQYSSVFSVHDGDLGCTDLIAHEIPLEDDIPVRQRYRRIPPSEYEVVKDHINQLLGSQIIRESSTPYASPIVMVKKKDGSPRMCVDYRLLNSKTRKDAFPLPRIDESLDALTGVCWFSTMDLTSGYNQVPVASADRPKTAFCTPFGLFEWNRMPFGLCNAPSTFQRLMQRIFGDQQCQSLLLYLNDIVVFSSTTDQHLERLRVVLERLQREGLKVKLNKCAFFQQEVRYLGHVISDQGVSTDPDKIEAVARWPLPATLPELRSFLGFASYYRRFVEGFAKLAAPLHRLVAELAGRPSTRAEKTVFSHWTGECQRSFEVLKDKLCSAPVLAYADLTLPFILEVDASYGGLGAVLSQEQNGKVRPIAYASRGLRPTERNMQNYSSMKLEFLALKWAMTEKFREYLLGHRCVVYTDNNPLRHLTSAKLGATEQRWAAQLASFDFELKYRSGSSNKNADALSCQHPPEPQDMQALVGGTSLPEPLQQVLRADEAAIQAAVAALPHHPPSDVVTLQLADPVIQEVLVFWRRKQRPNKEERKQVSQLALVLLRQWDRLVEKNGVLYRQVFRPDGAEVRLQLGFISSGGSPGVALSNPCTTPYRHIRTAVPLRAANGLAIPYIGYLELDVELCGRFMSGCGVLVVRDPPGGTSSQAPGVLGMNIIRKCYGELFGQHGLALFDQPPVSETSETVRQSLQRCHQASITAHRGVGKVKVRGKGACRIPGGVMKVVAAPCSEQYSGGTVLFEPLDSGLPAGLLAVPALVPVVRGTTYIPIMNVGSSDVLLYPRAVVGSLEEVQVVSLPAGITEVLPQVATVASQLVSPSVQEQIAAMELYHLPAEVQDKVRALLGQYSSVFSVHDGDLGCTDLIAHEIPLEDDIPVRQRYRRIPPSEYEVVKDHINQLLGLLNSKTRKDAFPLPRIDESLDALTGVCWFSTMELTSGYNQVPVASADHPKTAFCTPFGLFEWNRMPFGLCNAPSTFQRLMQRIFGDQQCQSLLLYLDDIVVFSSTTDQHLERLRVVLERLQREGLKVKLNKCAFFQQEVRYLGHVISDQGVSTDPDKIEAVARWPLPATLPELRSFLGFASYYRRFVEGFAKLAAPLHRLVAELAGRPSTRAEKTVFSHWTGECQRSFEVLKDKLCSAPVLAYADFTLPFILEVDASYGGLGAVLSQEQNGKVRPIAYASRGLRPTERNMQNYSSMKLEFLALKWAMTEKFREYLLGHRCVVYTDNNPLRHLTSAKLGATEQRWAAQLASFDFELKYRSGSSNKNADALSRQHPPEPQDMQALVGGTSLPEPLQQVLRADEAAIQAAVAALPHHPPSDVVTLQLADPVIQEVLVFWRRKQRPNKEERKQVSQLALVLLRQWDRLVEKNGVLYRQVFRPDGAEVRLQLGFISSGGSPGVALSNPCTTPYRHIRTAVPV